jgi:hypothetical protein
VLLVAVIRLANRWFDVLNYLLRIVYRAVNAVVRAALWAEFKFRTGVVWLYRLLGRATIDAYEAFRVAARAVLIVARRWAESTVLGLGLFSAAALLAVMMCAWFTSYLNGGNVLEGVGSIALAVAVAGVIIVTWWTLTKWPAAHIAKSALHTIEGAGPSLFLTLVALGWVDGIIGMLGYGPIRPGWLTLGGTAILVVSTGYLLIKERRSKLQQSGSVA